MPVTVESVATLRRYFRGVVDRSESHGQNVSNVIYPLLGLVLLHMDDDSDIEVWGSERPEGNILWFQVGGTRYAFRYEHEDGTIEIRKGSHRGGLVAKFDNSSSVGELREVFRHLGPAPPR
jgi:hypothetical protein